MTRAHRRVSQQQSDSVVPSARRKSIRNAARASGPARSSCTGSAMRTVHRQIVWDELAVKAIDSHFVFGMIYPPVKRRSRSCRRKKCHSAVRQWQSDIFCLNPHAVHVKCIRWASPPDTFIIVGIRRWAQAFFPSSAVFCLLCRRVIAAKPPENAHIEQYPAQIIQYMHLLLCNSLQVQWTFPVDAAIMKTNDISRRYAPWFWRDFCAMCAFIRRRTSRPTPSPARRVSASWARLWPTSWTHSG